MTVTDPLKLKQISTIFVAAPRLMTQCGAFSGKIAPAARDERGADSPKFTARKKCQNEL